MLGPGDVGDEKSAWVKDHQRTVNIVRFIDHTGICGETWWVGAYEMRLTSQQVENANFSQVFKSKWSEKYVLYREAVRRGFLDH